MQKTIVVRVTRRMKHNLYVRYVQVVKKFYAHDEQGDARVGDTVRIVETRPMSKLKRWRLAEVMSRSTISALTRGEPGNDSDAKLADRGR